MLLIWWNPILIFNNEAFWYLEFWHESFSLVPDQVRSGHLLFKEPSGHQMHKRNSHWARSCRINRGDVLTGDGPKQEHVFEHVGKRVLLTSARSYRASTWFVSRRRGFGKRKWVIIVFFSAPKSSSLFHFTDSWSFLDILYVMNSFVWNLKCANV